MAWQSGNAPVFRKAFHPIQDLFPGITVVIQVIAIHIIEIQIKCKGKFQIIWIIVLHIHKKLIFRSIDVALIGKSDNFLKKMICFCIICLCCRKCILRHISIKKKSCDQSCDILNIS